MPSSTWHNIETFGEIIRELTPASFLDIGAETVNGAFLSGNIRTSGTATSCARSGVASSRASRSMNLYENTHQREMYNKIHIGNATNVINKLGSFDIIYAGDVLEHIEKDLSIKLIQKLAAKAKMALICSIPLGAEWQGKRGYENDHEDHVSSRQIQELQALGFTYYNVTADPADKTRSIGFFVQTSHDLAVSGLKRLGPGWFASKFGGR